MSSGSAGNTVAPLSSTVTLRAGTHKYTVNNIDAGKTMLITAGLAPSSDVPEYVRDSTVAVHGLAWQGNVRAIASSSCALSGAVHFGCVECVSWCGYIAGAWTDAGADALPGSRQGDGGAPVE